MAGEGRRSRAGEVHSQAVRRYCLIRRQGVLFDPLLNFATEPSELLTREFLQTTASPVVRQTYDPPVNCHSLYALVEYGK
jgi:hypothetical protein